MEIRTATPGDAGAIAGLAGAFRDHLQRSTPTDAQFRASVAHLLEAPDARFCLACRGDEPVGYVLLRFRFSMWAGGLDATLEDLFVTPGGRGQGVGRALVEAALDRAEVEGCVSICLDTNEHNLASNRIYAQLGFSAISRRWNGRQIFLRRPLPR